MLQTFNEFEQINRMLRAEEEEEEEEINKTANRKRATLHNEKTNSICGHRTQEPTSRECDQKRFVHMHSAHFISKTLYKYFCVFTIQPRWKLLKKLDTQTHHTHTQKAEQTEAKRINLVAIFMAYLWTVWNVYVLCAPMEMWLSFRFGCIIM